MEVSCGPLLGLVKDRDLRSGGTFVDGDLQHTVSQIWQELSKCKEQVMCSIALNWECEFTRLMKDLGP